MIKKDVYFFISHLDDFEISCIGYLSHYAAYYDKINVFIATNWDNKKDIWEENLSLIQQTLGIEINYHNFNYSQRTLMKNIDDLKDDFYKKINFNKRFDIISHDKNDCHTDHRACSIISLGIFKYASKFITIYSPSSVSFNANFWIGLPEDIYQLKKTCIDKYDINSEQSYSKLGYYIQSEKHYNIGKSYYIENFAFQEYKYYETYKILKQVT